MAFDFGWLCKISHTKITNSRRKCSREAVHLTGITAFLEGCSFYPILPLGSSLLTGDNT